jgi:hypothetical protein
MPAATGGAGFGDRARLVVPVVTVTVWIELVVEPSELLAVTAYENELTPVGTFPVTVPELGSTDSHDGAPDNE